MLRLKEMAQSGVKQNKALWEDIYYQTEPTAANSVGALHQGTRVPLRDSCEIRVSVVLMVTLNRYILMKSVNMTILAKQCLPNSGQGAISHFTYLFWWLIKGWGNFSSPVVLIHCCIHENSRCLLYIRYCLRWFILTHLILAKNPILEMNKLSKLNQRAWGHPGRQQQTQNLHPGNLTLGFMLWARTANS